MRGVGRGEVGGHRGEARNRGGSRCAVGGEFENLGGVLEVWVWLIAVVFGGDRQVELGGVVGERFGGNEDAELGDVKWVADVEADVAVDAGAAVPATVGLAGVVDANGDGVCAAEGDVRGEIEGEGCEARWMGADFLAVEPDVGGEVVLLKMMATCFVDQSAVARKVLRYQPTPVGKKPPGLPVGLPAAIGPAMDQSCGKSTVVQDESLNVGESAPRGRLVRIANRHRRISAARSQVRGW